MNHRLNSYTAYSVACAIIWAVILIAVAAGATAAKLHTFWLLFAGWVIGWTSATIARYVYPPPKARGSGA
jgi:biotin transporter BioY